MQQHQNVYSDRSGQEQASGQNSANSQKSVGAFGSQAPQSFVHEQMHHSHNQLMFSQGANSTAF